MLYRMLGPLEKILGLTRWHWYIFTSYCCDDIYFIPVMVI